MPVSPLADARLMLARLLQLLKALEPMLTTELGIRSVPVGLAQLWNASLPMPVSELADARSMLDSASQSKKAPLPMVATEPGMVSVPAARKHDRNASLAMPVSALADARSMLPRLLQKKKALMPMVATEPGMVSVPVILEQLLKALSSIVRNPALANCLKVTLLSELEADVNAALPMLVTKFPISTVFNVLMLLAGKTV